MHQTSNVKNATFEKNLREYYGTLGPILGNVKQQTTIRVGLRVYRVIQ